MRVSFLHKCHPLLASPALDTNLSLICRIFCHFGKLCFRTMRSLIFRRILEVVLNLIVQLHILVS